jgi:hypothetical protein
MQIAEEAIHKYGALQDEWEFAVLLQIVQLHRPVSMLEIGSYTGGSLYAWRQALPGCHIFGCTLGDAPNFHSWGASMIFGDSTSSETKASLAEKCADVDFVFVDGGHDQATAQSDMELAVGLVTGTGLVGIHDINLFYRYPELDGPRTVWNAWRARSYPTFEIANMNHKDPGIGLLWNR